MQAAVKTFTVSCGIGRPIKSLIGSRFNRLVVIGDAGTNGICHKWICLCDCGRIKSVIGDNLKRGSTKSCGCLHVENGKTINLKHGMRKSPEYKVWSGIKDRCHNPSANGFNRYGGRGIRVCNRWLHSFENFLADMGRKPSPNHTIERKNNNIGYSPTNCMWAGRGAQANNRSTNKFVSIGGVSKTYAQWCKEFKINPATLFWRISNGQSPIDALTRPTRKYTPRK